MNVYDTANRLAQEIKESEEFMNFKMARQVLNMKPDLKERMKKFEEARYETQIEMMQTGKENPEKKEEVQKLFSELIEEEDAKRYFDAETKFNIILTDVNKIIGDSVKELLQ